MHRAYYEEPFLPGRFPLLVLLLLPFERCVTADAVLLSTRADSLCCLRNVACNGVTWTDCRGVCDGPPGSDLLADMDELDDNRGASCNFDGIGKARPKSASLIWCVLFRNSHNHQPKPWHRNPLSLLGNIPSPTLAHKEAILSIFNANQL